MSTPAGSRLRIGDAERDAAAASLGDHFAAGRLSRDEFDDRLERAWAARTAEELHPLFLDLPGATDRWVPARSEPSVGFAGRDDRRPVRRRGPRLPPLLMFVLAVALLITVVVNAGPILFVLAALWFFGIIGHRGRPRCGQALRSR